MASCTSTPVAKRGRIHRDTGMEALSKPDERGRIVIVGAGIVGAQLAQALARESARQVVVLDRSLSPLLGSTGHAPGFVGQLNSIPTLTTLAKRTVQAYRQVSDGFQVVGGLEVAESDAATEVLKERLQLAEAAGLEARLLTPDEAEAVSPAFIDRARTVAALLFPSDGTARADILTAHARKKAEKLGALFLEADVLGIRISEGVVRGVETAAVGIVIAGSSTKFIPSDLVIITTGIWASQTLPKLPVLPVAHPYIHSLPRPALPGPPSPFVRWPEAHVYARDHGDC